MINIGKIIRVNLQRLMKINDVANTNALAKISKVNQKTAYNIVSLNGKPNINPTIGTLNSFAKKLGVEAWMIIIEDFPFSVVKKPIKKISAEGYALLEAFENSSPETKLIILKQLAYFTSEIDGDKASSNKVSEASENYQVNLKKEET